jgi:hypothetical protein
LFSAGVILGFRVLTMDFVLSEFHLGATYDAVLRRHLWHHQQADALAVPLLILALTYSLSSFQN